MRRARGVSILVPLFVSVSGERTILLSWKRCYGGTSSTLYAMKLQRRDCLLAAVSISAFVFCGKAWSHYLGIILEKLSRVIAKG